MVERKKYFMDCHVAGRMYHDADEVWDELKVGTLLKLERDKENRYDPDAVAIMYEKTDEPTPYCIGYIPREENGTIAAFLEMGWKDIFECRISKLNSDTHPERQIYVTIIIKRHDQ
ncbi:MAG: HIRAN domain-containing protein [Bacteroidaceae bacterium]|nr:HIRAN domain-containing protein [Bacteroidaceae bacterium]